MALKWLIVAGGTGGHLFPAIAIAEELIKRGREVEFVSGTRDVEKMILKDAPFKVHHIDVEGFLGRGIHRQIRAFFKLNRAVLKSLAIVKKFNPDVIFATGGYVSVPVVIAGKLKGKPTGLHEQNSIPGVANRLLSKLVDKVFISIKGSEAYFPEKKVVISGNPVRESVLKSEIGKKTGKQLLILGGSLGARFINDVSLKIVPELLKTVKDLKVVHQTGTADFERVKKEYERALDERETHRVEVYPFIRDMGSAYGASDLVLARAGATTLAELFATGKPAVLIPFPYATHNHQEKNAELVAKKGGAILMRESEVTAEKLLKTLYNLLTSDKKLKEMAEVMKSFYIPESKEVIINEMEGLLSHA